jgi:hypothetical protein
MDDSGLDQQINLEAIAKDLPNIDRVKLEECFIELLRQNYHFQNNCTKIIKAKLGLKV